jgi:hypothetical protein
VVLNLHGHEGKEKGHYLVNSGTVYFQQMVNFVMEERSFSRKCAAGCVGYSFSIPCPPDICNILLPPSHITCQPTSIQFSQFTCHPCILMHLSLFLIHLYLSPCFLCIKLFHSSVSKARMKVNWDGGSTFVYSLFIFQYIDASTATEMFSIL